MDFNTGKKSARRDEATGEHFEDAESDADWIEPSGDHLKETKSRLEQIQKENETLKAQLLVEKRKLLKFHKKLKYIQDNQQIFSRLKEAYLSMKYNESRNLLGIKETCSQTWDGIICENCIKTAEYKAQKEIEDLCGFTGNPIISRNPVAIDDILDTISQIRNLVDKREKANALSEQKESKYVEIIKSLENQNKILHELLKAKDMSAYPKKLLPHDITFLKKIIFKQEKRIREMLKYNRYRQYTISPLNDKEKEFVELVVSQYLKKSGKNSITNIRCRSCDREPKPEFNAFLWPTVPEEVQEHAELEQNIPKKENQETNLIDFSETIVNS